MPISLITRLADPSPALLCASRDATRADERLTRSVSTRLHEGGSSMTTQEGNPISGFHIEDASARDFKDLVTAFNEWAKQQSLPAALGLTDGWHDISPEQSLNFLIRTAVHGANRRPSFNTVLHYAQQMR